MHKHTFVALAVVTGLAGSTLARPPFLINELRVDQTGADNDEYFELSGTAGASMAGMAYIVIGDGTGGSGVIESVTDLSAFSIAGDGLFWGAETTITLGTPDATFGAAGLNFENTDNVTHMLVSGWSGTLNMDVDTNDDGVFDVTPWTSIDDSVALILPGPGDLTYSSTMVGPDGAFHPGHIFRWPDGNWAIGQFNPSGGQDTPGNPNPVPGPGALALLAFTGLMARRRRN